MNQLMEKLEKLESEERKILREQGDILEKMISLKNEKADFLSEEMKYSENKSKLSEIRNKKRIIWDAIDVLEGND